MFNLDNYPEIINHLKSISSIFKQTNNNWIQMFCPYCGDATRKVNPKHGHLYLSKTFPYFLCFRCNISGNLLKLLIYTNFNNISVINELKRNSKSSIEFIYNKKNIVSNIIKDNIYDLISKQHDEFIKNYGIENYNLFRLYLDKRSIDIYPINYLISPVFINGEVYCQFYNYDFEISSCRSINQKKHLHNKLNFYYFQDNLNNIIEYNNIVICEGVFDIINCQRFIFKTLDYFYIAINSSFYIKSLNELISKYCLLGDYNFHVIIDKDYTNKIELVKYKFPENIKIKFYTTIAGKDIGDNSLIKEVII